MPKALKALIYSLALTAAIHTGAAQPAEAPFSRPSMLLTITVEGLSEQYLDLLRPILCADGFKRLTDKGVTFPAIDFGPSVDAAAAAAIIHTGAAPTVNGIPAATVYNPESKRARSVLFDAATLGNFTDETLSPKAICVTTIADELRVDTDGAAMVYSIAATPDAAIIPAAHTANGAYWINTHTGNWASSTFYPDMHPSVASRNYRSPLSSRLDTTDWKPLLSIEGYPLLSNLEKARSFRHTYPKKDFKRFARFVGGAMANTEVTSMAIDIINASRLGANNASDLLALSYSVAPRGASRAEIIDSYLRLDRDLAKLFAAVDKSARAGVVILLAGLPAPASSTPYDSKWNIPSGQFSVKKALSLLDMYLMALHGNGDWVTGYHNHHFYLNKNLIKQRDLDISAFRAQVAEFLARMSGICNVYTIDDIIATRAGETPHAIRRNTSLPHSGDVIIQINPGWQLLDDTDLSASPDVTIQSLVPAAAPLFLYAPGLSPSRVNDYVDARRIAPTIARIMNLRAPNGAALPPISF